MASWDCACRPKESMTAGTTRAREAPTVPMPTQRGNGLDALGVGQEPLGLRGALDGGRCHLLPVGHGDLSHVLGRYADGGREGCRGRGHNLGDPAANGRIGEGDGGSRSGKDRRCEEEQLEGGQLRAVAGKVVQELHYVRLGLEVAERGIM